MIQLALQEWWRSKGKDALHVTGSLLGVIAYIGITGFSFSYLAPEPGEPEEVSLDPPGWVCLYKGDYLADQCYPADGYHVELDLDDNKIAIHDITQTQEERQRDLDVALGWHLLNNEERQNILDGRKSIYDYVYAK